MMFYTGCIKAAFRLTTITDFFMQYSMYPIKRMNKKKKKDFRDIVIWLTYCIKLLFKSQVNSEMNILDAIIY